MNNQTLGGNKPDLNWYETILSSLTLCEYLHVLATDNVSGLDYE